MITITSSWDDGHPTDLRLADLLREHHIAATFYVPRRSQRDVITDAQLRELAADFEIGAHTLDHIALTTMSVDDARKQITDSRKWIQDVVGEECAMFCPPLGKFDRSHHGMIRDAGFRGYRTVEMLSVERPAVNDGLNVMATTLQAHPHPRSAYLKNSIKRMSWSGIRRCMAYRSGAQWKENVPGLFQSALASEGVFHLWGHAWEIDENNQWSHLNDALGQLSDLAREHAASIVSNGELVGEARERAAQSA